ncbi:MAG: response regulator [Flavobacteriales bacterium]|nr:response regulator [Flavobacteriales bacterium]MCB9448898.1 response regulator [Flavobacteriales bacterium]
MEKQFTFEIKVIVAIVITVLIVGASGIFAYKSISGIVNSLNDAAKPDITQILLKDILSDISNAESSVQSYSIIKEPRYLIPYYHAVTSIDEKIDKLYDLSAKDRFQRSTIDSVSKLIEKKFLILDSILNMQERDQVDLALKKISEKLKTGPNKKASTAEEKENSVSNIFNKIFNSRKPADTAQPLPVPIEEMQHEIARIQQFELKRSQEMKAKQLAFTRQSKLVNDHIQTLILQLEDQEIQRIEEETGEAEAQAIQTNRMIAAFCAAASIMLLLVGFVIINYTRKNNAYRKILKEAKADAEQLAKARENFMATMSHEIRTPMNAIVGFTEQVLQSNLRPEQKEQLDMVKKSADHLLRIINEILDYSKLEAGKLELEYIGFNPGKLIEEITLLMKPQAIKKNLDLTWELENSVPQILLGDPVRLKQILLNIVGNAIKFTEQGNIRIHAKPVLSGNTNLYLELKVTDTGIGINKEHLEKVFREFEQAETHTSRKYGGTGLGLTITRKLVEIQGGDIQVDSLPGKGTTITMTLPYGIGNESDLPQEGEAPVPYEHLSNINVLFADDEAYNRILLATILKKWNVRFTEVQDGQAAVNELRQRHYDIVLMDIRMPEMDGIEATKMIRTQLEGDKASVPIIALTAVTSQEDMRLCREAGMNDFLAKPFKEKELYRKLLDHLHIIPNENIQAGKTSDAPPASPEQNATKKYNLRELYDAASGNETFVADMIGVFNQSTREGIQQIKQAAAKNNWKMVANVAHKISAPCRHMELTDMLDLIKDIESKARDKTDINLIPGLISRLDAEAGTIIPLLEKEIEKRTGKPGSS